ncbi:MAG: hypothetical protein ACLFP6_04330 [Spirochaetaceae bacterium]
MCLKASDHSVEIGRAAQLIYRASSLIVTAGAGRAAPTVRRERELFARRFGAPLIRVNPREPELEGAGSVSLAAGALEATEALG